MSSFDPSTVGTTTVSATSYPYQRKGFDAAGRHWVFYTDGTYFGFKSSIDGVTWSDFTKISSIPAGAGWRFSVFFDGINVHYAFTSEGSGSTIYYNRGKPNADGTITWVTGVGGEPKAVVWGMYGPVTPLSVEACRYPSVTVISGDVYQWRENPPGFLDDWTTRVDIGTYAAGNYFIFIPTKTVSVPYGTSLPPTIQLKGWQTSGSVNTHRTTWLDGRLVLRVRIRNPTAVAHAGRVHVRLWKAASADLSGAVALSPWTASATLSFPADSVNYTFDTDINIDVLAAVGNAKITDCEYVYIEFAWEITTAGAGGAVQIAVQAASTYLTLNTDIMYQPTIAVDSDGYPWIGFGRYNINHVFFYVAKGNANNGTWAFHLCAIRKLSTFKDLANKQVCPVSLTGGKMLIIYGTLDPWSQYWDGVSWGSEKIIGATYLRHEVAFSAIADGDTVHYVYLDYYTLDIRHRKWTPDVWAAVATIHTATTKTTFPVLSLGEAAETLYCFYGTKTTVSGLTAEHIYYRKYSAGVWGPLVDWIDESIELLTGADRLTCYYKAYENKIGLVYMTKTASPFNVRFAFLTPVVPIVIIPRRKLLGVGR